MPFEARRDFFVRQISRMINSLVFQNDLDTNNVIKRGAITTSCNRHVTMMKALICFQST